MNVSRFGFGSRRIALGTWLGICLSLLGGTPVWAQSNTTNKSIVSAWLTKEERLGNGLNPAMFTHTWLSADGRHVAMAQQLDNRRLMVFVDGRPGPDFDWVGFFAFSLEDGHYAYVGRNGRQEVIVRDGKIDSAYDKIVDEKAFNQLAFSPDGRHLAHWARKGKWHVFLDGQAGPEFDRISCPNGLVFSGGGRLAYAGDAGGKCRIVVDGQVAGDFDPAPETLPQFSLDGQHCAFVAKQGGQSRVFLDQQPSPAFEEVGPFLCFSLDGRHLAYTVRQNSRWRVCRDNELGYGADGIVPFVTFSPDSKRFAYVAERAAKFQVVIDNQPGPAFDEILAMEYFWVQFSPDSRRTAYGARIANKWIMVVDGKMSRGYDQILPAPLFFSPNSRHVGYFARNGPLWTLVWDDVPGAPFDELGPTPVLLSLDGERYAYAGRRGTKWFPVLNGQEGPARENIGALDASVFSPDSKRVAWVIRPLRERDPGGAGVLVKGDYSVVVDGKSDPGFAQLLSGPRFSPDSQHVTYAAKPGLGQALAVIDGIAGALYEEIIVPGPRFLNNREVEYLALRQGTLYRIRHTSPNS